MVEWLPVTSCSDTTHTDTKICIMIILLLHQVVDDITSSQPVYVVAKGICEQQCFFSSLYFSIAVCNGPVPGKLPKLLPGALCEYVQQYSY